MTLGQRLLAVGAGLACLALWAAAAYVTPNPAGVGTHTGLGLSACNFLYQTGLPCGSCGMTTSFAYFVRGNWLAAFYLQPMGATLALLSGMTLWGAGYLAVTGRPIHRLFSLLPGRYVFVPLVGLFFAAWGWKILIHLKGMDGWR